MMRMRILSMVLVAATFALGCLAGIAYSSGQAAMTAFMTAYSSLAFLEKGDRDAAMGILRASAEGNLLEADRYGDLPLWLYDREAMAKWFVQYSKLRERLPEATRGPTDPEFDRNVQRALDSAASRTGGRF